CLPSGRGKTLQQVVRRNPHRKAPVRRQWQRWDLLQERRAAETPETRRSRKRKNRSIPTPNRSSRSLSRSGSDGSLQILEPEIPEGRLIIAATLKLDCEEAMIHE